MCTLLRLLSFIYVGSVIRFIRFHLSGLGTLYKGDNFSDTFTSFFLYCLFALLHLSPIEKINSGRGANNVLLK